MNGVPFKLTKTLANMPRRREIREKLKPFYEWFSAMTRVTNSVASVVNADDMPVTRNGFLYGSMSVFFESVYRLMGDGAGEHHWRLACSNARACGPQYKPWDSCSFEEKFGIHHAPAMKKFIEYALWGQFGGWRQVEVVVQPGEKP